MSEEKNLSPLYEADPNSIDEFFLRLKNNQIQGMPKEILDLDLNKKVKSLRDERIKFIGLQNDLNKTKANKKPKQQNIQTIIQKIKDAKLDFS